MLFVAQFVVIYVFLRSTCWTLSELGLSVRSGVIVGGEELMRRHA
jgi:hypothetical protein